MHPAILDEWTEVLDVYEEGWQASTPEEVCALFARLHEEPVCFAGHCYASHDEAVHAVQHDAPVTIARWMPCEHDLLD